MAVTCSSVAPSWGWLGNTEPAARLLVHGLRERGAPSDGTFVPRTGKGYVKAVQGDYDRAAASGVTVHELLVETFGGLGRELIKILKLGAEYRDNKLTSGEFDETTWSARTWLTFVWQRISVATQRAAAMEIGQALGLSMATDPRAA